MFGHHAPSSFIMPEGGSFRMVSQQRSSPQMSFVLPRTHRRQRLLLLALITNQALRAWAAHRLLALIRWCREATCLFRSLRVFFWRLASMAEPLASRDLFSQFGGLSLRALFLAGHPTCPSTDEFPSYHPARNGCAEYLAVGGTLSPRHACLSLPLSDYGCPAV